jgi:hypothetical protein
MKKDFCVVRVRVFGGAGLAKGHMIDDFGIRVGLQ